MTWPRSSIRPITSANNQPAISRASRSPEEEEVLQNLRPLLESFASSRSGEEIGNRQFLGSYSRTTTTTSEAAQWSGIGIRMALGAQRSDVLGLVVRQGMTLAAIGVVAGLAGAFSLTRVMASLLFNVRPDDPTTYLAISFLLIVVAFLACYLPARRAAKLDPMIALSRT